MADDYIDNEETQVYGPKLRQNVTLAFAGSPESVRRFVEGHVVARQKTADEAMAAALSDARTSRSAASGAVSVKNVALRSANRFLAGLSKHVDAALTNERWEGDRKVVLPRSLRKVGSSIESLRDAVTIAQKALLGDETFPDREHFLSRAKRLLRELEDDGGVAREANHGAVSALSEQADVKLAWLATYRGNVLVIEGLLMQEGREDELSQVIPHLAVAGKGKAADEPEPEEG